MAEISTKPYLIRAIYEWCCDNGYTPHLVVRAGSHVRVPQQYVRNGEIILNVSASATHGLEMGNEQIEFQARFGGVAEYIVVPVSHVMAIFARETGFIVPFGLEGGETPAEGADEAPVAETPSGAERVPDHAAGGDVVDLRSARAARPTLRSVPDTRTDPPAPPASSPAGAQGGIDDAAALPADGSAPVGRDDGADTAGTPARNRRKPAAGRSASARRTPSATAAGAAKEKTVRAKGSGKARSKAEEESAQPPGSEPIPSGAPAPASPAADDGPPPEPPPVPTGGRPRLVRVK